MKIIMKYIMENGTLEHWKIPPPRQSPPHLPSPSLHSGRAWLAREISVTDLILNAIALELVLRVDELLFSTVVSE